MVCLRQPFRHLEGVRLQVVYVNLRCSSDYEIANVVVGALTPLTAVKGRQDRIMEHVIKRQFEVQCELHAVGVPMCLQYEEHVLSSRERAQAKYVVVQLPRLLENVLKSALKNFLH